MDNLKSAESKTGFLLELSRYEKAKKIINDGSFVADCKFVVGPEDETAEIIHGHKIYFIMESPVFEKMFSGNYLEAEEKTEIRLTDVSPHVFKNLCYMIYTNSEANLNKSSLEEILILYRLCDKYMLSSILQICINYIKNPEYLKQTSIDNLITVFEFARDLEDKSLLQVTRKAIQTRCTNTFNSRTNTLTEEAFYDYVQTLSEATLEGFTRAADKELYIFSVINSYFVINNLMEILNNDKQVEDNLKDNLKKIEHTPKKFKNCESVKSSKICELNPKTRIKNLLQNLLKLIKFGEMSIRDFQYGPGPPQLLDDKQKYYIISRLLDKCKCSHSYKHTHNACKCAGSVKL